MPQVFGEDGVRLMCWSHVFRNIRPKLAAIRKANAALGASMLADIESIQWMAQSEAEFELVCEKFKSHYLEQDLGEVERKLVTDFVEYFLSQWGPGSHAAGWYAGAHPFSLTNNHVCCQFFKCFQVCFFYSTWRWEGLEGTYKEVKTNHTFRTELPYWASSSRCWSSW